MRVLDLFAGIGGFTLGLERAGFETVAFCEIEPYAQKVLAKHWPGVPIYDDVRQLTAERLIRDGIGVDVITGGFPCQDVSASGRKAGIDGERSGLYRELLRICEEVQPRYVLIENVRNLLSGDKGGWFRQFLRDFSKVGFDAEWHVIPASSLGASHKRERVWIVAYPSSPRSEAGLPEAGYRQAWNPEITHYLGDRLAWWQGCRKWEPEPRLDRVVDGFPSRSHRLKCLGNAVVPQIPELIGRAILEAENAG